MSAREIATNNVMEKDKKNTYYFIKFQKKIDTSLIASRGKNLCSR